MMSEFLTVAGWIGTLSLYLAKAVPLSLYCLVGFGTLASIVTMPGQAAKQLNAIGKRMIITTLCFVLLFMIFQGPY
jgi:hypothetical protein